MGDADELEVVLAGPIYDDLRKRVGQPAFVGVVEVGRRLVESLGPGCRRGVGMVRVW